MVGGVALGLREGSSGGKSGLVWGWQPVKSREGRVKPYLTESATETIPPSGPPLGKGETVG